MKLMVTAPMYWLTKDLAYRKCWLYLASCDKFGVDASMRRFYGIGATQYPGGGAMRIGGQAKFLTTNLHEFNKEGFTHVLFSDAWDVLFVRPVEELIKTYMDMGAPEFLMGASHVQHGMLDSHPPQTELYIDLFSHTDTYRYPSTTFHMGRIDVICDQLSRIDGGDTHNETYPVLEAFRKGWFKPTLDRTCQIFQEKHIYCEIRDGRVWNPETNSFPFLVHFSNGYTDQVVGKDPVIIPWAQQLGIIQTTIGDHSKMNDRKEIATTKELGDWYDRKYVEMGDGWTTPPEECNRHLDDLGVPFDKTKTLLDIGCGAGHFLAEATKRVRCLGLEISYEGIKHSRRRAPEACLEYRSIENGVESNALAPFDYIVALGSLEHVVDIDRALDQIRSLLKPNGRFYFYCPNESWKHFDQPNERTMRDTEWIDLFCHHGLSTYWSKRWNDSTAFCGGFPEHSKIQPAGTKLNCGSGQRPFDRSAGWINIDINQKWNPDVVADWNELSMFADDSIDIVVSHHSLEHVGCGEGDSFIREAHRVLRPEGSLLVFVPDSKALAKRFLLGEIDEYTFNVNMYGAYMGAEADRHKWSYSREGLWQYLKKAAPWKDVHAFNWRPIPGADIAGPDWWIQGQEAIK